MANYNRTILMGNLVADPITKQVGDQPLTEFTVAWNQRKKGGEDKGHFFDCEAWGRTAETVGQFLRKGSGVLVEGLLHQHRWDDKDNPGKTRSRIKVKVDRVEFLPKNSAANQQSHTAQPAVSTSFGNEPSPF